MIIIVVDLFWSLLDLGEVALCGYGTRGCGVNPAAGAECRWAVLEKHAEQQRQNVWSSSDKIRGAAPATRSEQLKFAQVIKVSLQALGEA